MLTLAGWRSSKGPRKVRVRELPRQSEGGHGDQMATPFNRTCRSHGWVWGALGLVGNLLSLNSEIGGAALSSQLLWIGGMLLFGLGALLLRPAVSAEDTVKHEEDPSRPSRA
jgi:hypothetical protein